MTEYSVFLSYSHQDVDRDWIRSFADALQEQNYKVWFDEVDIRPGDRIAESIEDALRASNAIIAVISGTFESRAVYFELGVALGANKRLILVVDPSVADSLPFDLRKRKWITLQEPVETAREVAEAIGPSG